VDVAFFKASYLDASAAIKLVLPEAGSDQVRTYFDGRGGFHMTSLCMAEALGVFKRKMLRSELSRDRYFASCYLLLNYLTSRIHIDDMQITDQAIFMKALEIARRHDLDLSDSLQLVSVKEGKFRHYVQESKTLFITADRALAAAARAEDLRVWDCEQETAPPPQ
jgi:predicted nucleic acid-binding protein